MFDWNDLRCFLAVAQHGSTIGAGKALRLSQSTVHRRIGELERRLSVKLVLRTPAGYRLTEAGKSLLPYAVDVEAAAQRLERYAAGEASADDGVIRLTCPEPIVQRLSSFIERFRAQYPNYQVEFVMSDRYLDLTKGDADVAFRSGDTEDELVGRKIADSIWAVYASRSYIERNGKPANIQELQNYPLVALDESMRGHRVAKWLNEVAPAARIAARNNSVLGLVYGVKAGLGIGPLPTAIADGEPDLVRILGPVPELARSWRLLTHPDLRRSPRIAAFFHFAIQEREALKQILTG
jgi:DNA-binding transcriptional LysR family regulator